MSLKGLVISLIIFFLFIVFIDLSNAEACLLGYSYDIPFWSFLETFVITASVVIAFITIRQSNENVSRQLKIEQTPYVVLDRNIELKSTKVFGEELIKVIDPEHLYDGSIYLKNIGRGFAKNIEVSYSPNKIEGLFYADQPHSIDLSQNEVSKAWRVDINILRHMLTIQEGRDLTFIYISYLDQLGNMYKTRIKLAIHADRYKLMGNELLVSQ
jgi:hypothetical protein